MKITSILALKDIRKNKRRNFVLVIGIMLATILLFTSFTILGSYQEYVTNIMRDERNWEAEFKNIKYSKAAEIAKDKNIKEISIMQNFGKSEEDFYVPEKETDRFFTERIEVYAFDENAIKNANVNLKEGRLPKNKSELVIGSYRFLEDNESIKVGKEVELTLNGEKKKYTIVGVTDKDLPKTPEVNFSLQIVAIGMTCFDETLVNEDTIVDVSVITNNIKNIYKTTENLAKNLNLYETEELQEKNIDYYNNLLNYSLVKKDRVQKGMKTYGLDIYSQKFEADIRIVTIGIIGVIGIASVIVIYTTFKMLYQEKVKELGMLASIRNE